VDVYGASTKGNILLQVLDVGPGTIRQAIDRSPAKWGRYTVTGIPIVGEEQGKVDLAAAWLVPIWQFRESVLLREQDYLAQGGTLIFPLPVCEIIRRTWGDWDRRKA
jgi:NDP-4-keto-2,6-dideoxyhexose 3-C-methyltransferase